MTADTIRKVALGTHLFVAGWMLINGAGHQIHVLWKAHHGTLKPEANVYSLLIVGAALLAVSAAFSVSGAALLKPGGPLWPGFASIAFFAAVIAAIAATYGFTFLFGSIVLSTAALITLCAHAIAR